MAVASPRMVFLGFGKWARADRIYALEPLEGDERGARPPDARLGRGRAGADRRLAHRADDPRTRWARTAGQASPVLDEALDLAERLATAVEEGRVDLGDLGRRARRVLERTARPPEAEQLF